MRWKTQLPVADLARWANGRSAAPRRSLVLVAGLPAKPGEDLAEDVVTWYVPAFVVEAFGCGDVGGQPVAVGAWHAGVV
jgi:hypothetical protein